MTYRLKAAPANPQLLHRQARLCGILATATWLATALAVFLQATGDLVLAGVIAAAVFTVLFACLVLVLDPQRLSRRATLVTTLALLVIGANTPLLARASELWPVLVALLAALTVGLATWRLSSATPERS